MAGTSNSPNILIITTDQQRWDTFGFLNPQIRTENLDRLTRQGVVFNRAYCSNPTCTPCRSSMVTGKYASQHGAWALGTKLPEDEHTIGEDFSRAGYRTALVGKAHFQPLRATDEFPSIESYPIMQDLEFWKEFHGPFYGFEHVELARNHADEAHVGQHYAIWMEEKGLHNWRQYFRPPTGTRDGTRRYTWHIPEEYHYNTWIAERSNALMEEYHAAGRPFLLWASFLDPHTPYLAPEPWDTLYDPQKLTAPSVTPGEHENNPPHFRLTQEAKPDFSPWRESGQSLHGFSSHLRDRETLAKDMAVYYGMVTLLDKYVGAILDRLESLGLADDTLVIYSTDHGHFYGQHGLVTKGAFHYEDLVKVPLFVRWPGRIPAGVRSDALQSHVDLAPTLLSMAGLEIPRTMTGLDQSKVWLGEK